MADKERIAELEAVVEKMTDALGYFAESDCDGGHDIPNNASPEGFTIALEALGEKIPEEHSIKRPWTRYALSRAKTPSKALDEVRAIQWDRISGFATSCATNSRERFEAAAAFTHIADFAKDRAAALRCKSKEAE